MKKKAVFQDGVPAKWHIWALNGPSAPWLRLYCCAPLYRPLLLCSLHGAKRGRPGMEGREGRMLSLYGFIIPCFLKQPGDILGDQAKTSGEWTTAGSCNLRSLESLCLLSHLRGEQASEAGEGGVMLL